MAKKITKAMVERAATVLRRSIGNFYEPEAIEDIVKEMLTAADDSTSDRTTWLTPFQRIYDHYRGEGSFDAKRAAKDLKPLIDAHGTKAVEDTFTNWACSSAVKYGYANFRANYADWVTQTVEVTFNRPTWRDEG